MGSYSHFGGTLHKNMSVGVKHIFTVWFVHLAIYWHTACLKKMSCKGMKFISFPLQLDKGKDLLVSCSTEQKFSYKT